jgi:hypothetical protein
MSLPNSYLLMYSPITRSCIETIFEKQIVLHCNLLTLILNVKCFLSVAVWRYLKIGQTQLEYLFNHEVFYLWPNLVLLYFRTSIAIIDQEQLLVSQTLKPAKSSRLSLIIFSLVFSLTSLTPIN